MAELVEFCSLVRMTPLYGVQSIVFLCRSYFYSFTHAFSFGHDPCEAEISSPISVDIIWSTSINIAPNPPQRLLQCVRDHLFQDGSVFKPSSKFHDRQDFSIKQCDYVQLLSMI